MPTVPLVVGADPRACADPVRAYAALYVGGMGSREQNFYNALAVRMGFGEAAATVQDLFLSGRPRDARAAVPFELIDQTSLLGDRARIADRLRVLAEVGVTTCSVVPYGGSVDLIMDFTDPIIRGMSLFHCHLLNHEDKGMMAKILFE